MIEKTASEKLTINQKRINKIVGSANNLNILTLSYRDKNGVRTKRNIEPYKITDTYLWGFDVEKQQIRQFKLNGIKGVKPISEKFLPRWNIDINK